MDQKDEKTFYSTFIHKKIKTYIYKYKTFRNLSNIIQSHL